MRLTASDDANADLPPVVRARIVALQDRSEQLIGWIQLAIVIFFGTLYALSRQTVPMTSMIWLLTPAAIGAYFVAVVIRLVMSYRIRMGFWLLAGSIAIDMALLYGLIWSFHLQYMQPASFYLKAPTQQYVYIFIALRALRFEVQYVVLAGAAAAFGWVMMIMCPTTEQLECRCSEFSASPDDNRFCRGNLSDFHDKSSIGSESSL